MVDDEGGQGRTCARADVIVTDPSAGIVTAGGQFPLPTADSSRPARGLLALVLGYFPGSEQPRGLTLLKVPGFCLGATQADWLVVTDSQATFSGAASVNGRSGYRYLVSLVDGGHGGRADLVRVRVWSPDTVVLNGTSAWAGAPRSLSGSPGRFAAMRTGMEWRRRLPCA